MTAGNLERLFLSFLRQHLLDNDFDKVTRTVSFQLPYVSLLESSAFWVKRKVTNLKVNTDFKGQVLLRLHQYTAYLNRDTYPSSAFTAQQV